MPTFQLDSCLHFGKMGLTVTVVHNEKVRKEVSFHLKVFYRLGMAVSELLEGFRLSPLQSQKPIIS